MTTESKALLILLVLFTMYATGFWVGHTIGTHEWDMTQKHFPCHEDEMLGYSPASTSHVVCIGIDRLHEESSIRTEP